jgi:aspartyl-tRNA(Asn)/glutamyl-tRNA(Gln) amidotransferase subunit B
LTATKELANYFEEAAKGSGEAKLAANWILSELMFLLNESNKGIAQSPVSAGNLAELLGLIQKGSISGKMGKDILAAMFASGKSANEVMAEKGLEQINDTEKIAAVVREIMAANPKQVEQYRSGKTATLGWFVGQVMKATRGQANPPLVQEILKKELS